MVFVVRCREGQEEVGGGARRRFGEGPRRRGTRGSEKKEDREDAVGGNGGVKEGGEEEVFAKVLFLGRRGTKERLENMHACANPDTGYEMSEHGHGMGMRTTGTGLLATPDQVDQSRSSTYRLVYFRHGRSNVQCTIDRGRGSRNPHWIPGKGEGRAGHGQRQGRGREKKKKKKTQWLPGWSRARMSRTLR